MVWILGILACGSSGPTELTDVAVAGIADEIAAAPDQADAILEGHGVARTALEAALFDIAADPARTKAYLDARR